MSSATRIPKRGDIFSLDFDPQAGQEQAKRRPALVLSPENYNRLTGLALFCPITSITKGYPFEVALPAGLAVQGVILTDQVKSLDWKAKKAAFICQLHPAELKEVFQKLFTLFEN